MQNSITSHQFRKFTLLSPSPSKLVNFRIYNKPTSSPNREVAFVQ
ncbi:4795_t:CDS:2 [Diversispora eburnea]|uniref:4795_t:CDS:1 n=1 Tax=Diversispora eburnea TaxID=1213867 RepID=A0A9N9FQZ0_9GLOM|nr:4795_t:CDS:2 [Diversispora eburnea]